MSSKELDFFTARIMEPERSRICSSRTKEIRCIRCQPIHPMNIPISMNYPHYSPFYKTLISKPDFWSPGMLIFGEGTNLVANDITTLGVHLLDYTTGSYGPGLTSCWKLDGKWEKLELKMTKDCKSQAVLILEALLVGKGRQMADLFGGPGLQMSQSDSTMQPMKRCLPYVWFFARELNKVLLLGLVTRLLIIHPSVMENHTCMDEFPVYQMPVVWMCTIRL